MIDDLSVWLGDEFPDLLASVKATSFGPPVNVPLLIRLSGSNADVLEAIAEEVRRHTDGLAGTRNVRDDWGDRVKRLRVDVDSAHALCAGVTERDVALSLQTALSGMLVSTFRDGDTLVPIMLRHERGELRSPDDLDDVVVMPQGAGKACRWHRSPMSSWTGGRHGFCGATDSIVEMLPIGAMVILVLLAAAIITLCIVPVLYALLMRVGFRDEPLELTCITSADDLSSRIGDMDRYVSRWLATNRVAQGVHHVGSDSLAEDAGIFH